MMLVNLNARHTIYEDRMTAQLEALTHNLAILGSKVDSLIDKLAQTTVERDAIQAKLDALAVGDSPEAIQAVVGTVAALVGKIPE
jgi:hypothetical protein